MFASRTLISRIPKAGLSVAIESCSSRAFSKFSACTSRTVTGFQQTTFSSLAKHKPSLVSRNYVNSLSTKSNPSNFFSRRWDQYSGGQTLSRVAPRTWSTPTLTPQQKLTATVLVAGGVMGLGSLYLYEQSTPEEVLRQQVCRYTSKNSRSLILLLLISNTFYSLLFRRIVCLQCRDRCSVLLACE